MIGPPEGLKSLPKGTTQEAMGLAKMSQFTCTVSPTTVYSILSRLPRLPAAAVP